MSKVNGDGRSSVIWQICGQSAPANLFRHGELGLELSNFFSE